MPSTLPPALEWELHGSTLIIAGELVSPDQIRPPSQLLGGNNENGPPIGILDLSELDIEDGPALARLVSWIRLLAARRPLRLDEAPQMLAHTLYKIGALEGGRIELRAPRMDQGTTAN
jgi:ABC-type transporter Mla MlaB component